MNRALRLMSAASVLMILGLTGPGVLLAQGGPSASGGPLVTYTNPQYSFTLQYPRDLVPADGGDTWSMAAEANGGPQGTPVVTIPVVHIDHDSTKPYPYPLFFSAWVSVGVSPDTVNCYEGIEAEPDNSTPKDVTIGGFPFKVGTTSDAGMSKYTIVTSYRTIHDGACFAIEQVENGSSYRDENTLPGLSVAELRASFARAGEIARSFRFMDTAPAAAAVPSGSVRLTFARGATRILTKGTLSAGTIDSYIVSAEAGQPVVLTTHGGSGSDLSLAVTSLPDGAVFQPDSPGRSGWTTVLSKSQELLVQVRNRGPATGYDLSVIVPAHVTLPPGMGSVARSGSTPAGLPVDYVLLVRAEQKVEVSLESTGSAATLKSVGFVTWSDVVNSTSGEAAPDTLELAPANDRNYLVSIVPSDAQVVRYQLTFTTRP